MYLCFLVPVPSVDSESRSCVYRHPRACLAGRKCPSFLVHQSRQRVDNGAGGLIWLNDGRKRSRGATNAGLIGMRDIEKL
jgi:hypothetical protein